VVRLLRVFEDAERVFLVSPGTTLGHGDLFARLERHRALAISRTRGCGGSARGGETASAGSFPGGRARERARRRLSEPQARACLRGVLSALAFLHARGIVHRDVKPENILMSRPTGFGCVVLADFGFAARVASNVGDSAPTKLYETIGTLGYCAPEVLRAGQRSGPPVGDRTVVAGGALPRAAPGKEGEAIGYDASADVFSAGVLLHLLLFGRMPFSGRTEQEVVRRTVWAPPAGLGPASSGRGGAPGGRAPGGVARRMRQRSADARARSGAVARAGPGARKLTNSASSGAACSATARALAGALLRKAPDARPSAAGALDHPWMRERDE
jgi:serine/threonine protein kinase